VQVKEKQLYIVLLFIFFVPFLSNAQKIKINDAEILQKNGDSAILVDYRLHRNPSLVIKELKKDSTNNNILHLYRGHVIYSSQESQYPKYSLPILPYKLDFQIKPFYYAEYGQFDNPVQTQIGMAPKVELQVWKGFYGVFQWYIPFQNDFKIRLGYESRPGELGVGYSFVKKQRHFFNTFLGTFINDRYGVYAEYIWSNRAQNFYLGGAAYLTGRFLWDEGVLYLDEEGMTYPSGTVFAAYRFIKHDLTVRLMAEKFLRDDQGFTMEVFRQFGSTDIGFYASKTKKGDNAGLFVTFALWPRKFYANKYVQLRLPHSFRLAYNLRPNTGIGEVTRPYTDFFYDIYRFNKNFINKRIE